MLQCSKAGKHFMLSEKAKDDHILYDFICSVQKKQIHRERVRQWLLRRRMELERSDCTVYSALPGRIKMLQKTDHGHGCTTLGTSSNH